MTLTSWLKYDHEIKKLIVLNDKNFNQSILSAKIKISGPNHFT